MKKPSTYAASSAVLPIWATPAPQRPLKHDGTAVPGGRCCSPDGHCRPEKLWVDANQKTHLRSLLAVVADAALKSTRYRTLGESASPRSG
jgi:hypothetical protein